MRLVAAEKYAGSRMHVLDWVEGRGGSLVDILNALLRPTGAVVAPEGPWRPKGYADPTEALLDRPSEPLLPLEISRRLRAWWLAVDHPKSSGPNWDLAVAASFPRSRRGLVLVEAKAHAGELQREGGGKRLDADASDNSVANHKRIAAAIDETREALGKSGAGVGIGRDRCYQFSNRVAFAWKLNQEGIPVALIYLGFTGDNVIGLLSEPIRDEAHWKALVAEHTATVLPAEFWETDIGRPGVPLWIIARSLPVARQSPKQRSSR